MTFSRHYQAILDDVMSFGSIERNARTGSDIRVLPCGASFALDLRDHLLPTCGLRRTKPLHSAAEAAWCLMGDRDLAWLRKYVKVWDKFAEVDKAGVYRLREAYGARWRDGVDQVALAIERLNADPSDRRVWVTAWDPMEDLGQTGQKTVPCPVGFTLAVMDGGLCSTLMIRSSDLYFGLPYDVMRHAYLMAAFASSLQIGLGHMRVSLAHPHVYRPQWPLVAEMMRQNTACPRIRLPNWSVDSVMELPDAYVEEIKIQLEKMHDVDWPEYDPKTNVVA